MIEYHTQPGGGVMAQFTGQGGGQVRRAFARGDVVVMTGLAGRCGLIMGKRYDQGQPAAAAVAGLALIGGQGMGTRFARSHCVVMTAQTVVRGLAVVNGVQRVPVVAGMASLAQVAGYRMGR